MLKNTTESLLEISKKFAIEIVEGLNQSVTPYHAVDYCSRKLVENGFKELNEK
jgi:aspartyl aminopeptidase